jgi:predicted transcriptional regulator
MISEEGYQMTTQVLLRIDEALRDRLAAAAERRGKSVQAILTGLAEEFLAADESDGAKRVAATKAWLADAASDPYFTETTVEQRDAVRDEAWS